MTDSFESRPFVAGDEDAIIGLFSESFGQELDLSAWRWRYLENPYGGPLIELMWDGAKLIGQYAVSPVNISINGTEYSCALSLDTMTHPDYGGRGIFTRLAASAYKRLGDMGRAMVWGFPNENSHHGFIKRLEWFDVAEVPLLTVTSKIDEEPQTSIQALEKFDTRVDRLFEQERTHWPCMAVRSAEYLNWRFMRHPTRHYYSVAAYSDDEMLGYCVYKLFQTPQQTVGDIVDLFCTQDATVFTDILIRAIQDLLRRGAVAINMWHSAYSPFYSAVLSLGFTSTEQRTFLGARTLSDTLPIDTVRSWANWYVQMGDSDVY